MCWIIKQSTILHHFLTQSGKAQGNPYSLINNDNNLFRDQLCSVMGFILTSRRSPSPYTKDPHNKDVLFPYLNGEDLNSRPRSIT